MVDISELFAICQLGMLARWDLTSWPFSAGEVALGLGIFVLSTVVTTAIVTAFLVSIPADHFQRVPLLGRPRQAAPGGSAGEPAGSRRSAALRLALAIGKNLLGAVLVIAGLALSLPGVPGQGLLTVLVGLLLLDIPGKRKLERRLVGRPALLRTINKLRARFKRPPLRLDEPASEEPADIEREL